MKRKRKIALILSLAFAIVATFANTAITSKAASSEPKVTITTDKTEYTDGDEIKETVTVKNVTNNTLTDVTVSGEIPEGYTTDDAEIVSGKWVKTITKLEAGKSTDLTVTLKVASSEGGSTTPESGSTTDTTTPDNKPTGDSNAPTTGDTPFIFLFLGLAVLSMGGIFFLVKSKKGRKLLSAILALAMVASLWQISPINASAEETATPPSDEYKLVWSDEFNGTELNRDDWNVELHDPGWVNAELQEYVDSDENIFLEDGKLVIKPIKTGTGDNATYTSGRVNTQGKNDFTYGYFEARVKVPKGQGYLPAFWLMATDETVYGQWPRCGEIDIMEVMGQSTDTLHGTIHYGNPHNQSQGTYVSKDSDFSEDFHTFAVEWEPGKISWYVDGQLYHTEDQWHSTTEGLGTLTYPAPFDQPFYIILNLAVGGSWVGYPDETTDFANATYEIDYVRVYQKDSYDENVTKPEKEVILREPDTDGNYIVNGDFAVKESLTDDKDWVFLTNGGTADTEINTVDKVTGEKIEEKTVAASKDIKIGGKAETLSVSVTYPLKTPTTKTEGALTIDTTNPGTLDYSVQLVQANLPMQKGATYELSFDAYADEARTMIVDISGPDNNYVRYFNDTKVNLTTEKQTFTYTFRMTHDDDANGRLEYNLGNTDPYSAVHLSNVSLKKIGYEEIVEDDSKKVLTDGNHVYNGAFQEGENRLEFWDIKNDANANVSVTDFADGRRLKVVVPEGTTAANPFVISQDEMAMIAGKTYAYSFDIEGATGTDVDVEIVSTDVNVPMTGSEFNKAGKITPADGADMSIKFTFSKPGTYYLDNVRIVEDSLIKNGDFSAGLAGFEPYAYNTNDVTWVVDSISEDNAIDFTIQNTGDQAWHIQLKQNNVELENGQWYRLSFDAKSSIARKLMFAIQRDGNKHNDDWTPYSGEKIVDLGSDYQTYSVEFQMTEPTDLESVLSISMGAVGGTQITEQHRICIDNILLEKIDAPETPTVAIGQELLKNTEFANDAENWSKNKLDTTTVTFNNGTTVWDITSVGANDYDNQLSQSGFMLEKGCNYKLTFKAKSTEARSIKYDFMSTSYNWYNGGTTALEANTEADIEFYFKMEKDTDMNSLMTISMGKIAGVDTPASTITLSDFSLTKVDSIPTPPTPPSTGGENLVSNGDFTNEGENWSFYGGTIDYSTGKAVITTTTVGTNAWDIQLMHSGVDLEAGEYKLTFSAESSVPRDIQLAIAYSIDGTDMYDKNQIYSISPTAATYTYSFTIEETTGKIQINLGNVNGAPDAATITFDDFVLEKVISSSIITNSDFSDGNTGWTDNCGVNWVDAVATATYSAAGAVFDITNVGTANWHIQLKQGGLTLDSTKQYKVTIVIESSVARPIEWGLFGDIDGGNCAVSETVDLEANIEKTISSTVSLGNDATAFILSLGKVGSGECPAGTITIKSINIEVVE